MEAPPAIPFVRADATDSVSLGAGNTAYAKRQYYEIERIESDKSIGNYSHFTHLVESATEGREPSKSSSKAGSDNDKHPLPPTVIND